MELTGSVAGIIKLLGGGSTVVITPLLLEGVPIAKITIDETDYYIYAPEGGSDITVTPTLQAGTKIGDITIGENTVSLYAPNPTSVSVSQTVSEGTQIGSITVNGVTTNLFAPASGGGGGVNYSTDEIKVGTYTENGVEYDLYEKTYKGVMNSNSHPISVNDLSIMNMVTINGKIWGNGVEYIMPFYSNNNYHGRISYNYNSKQVWIETTSDAWSYYRNYEIHIFYTKTN